MKTTKRVQHDGIRFYVEHNGTKYQPLITTRLRAGQTVSVAVPPGHADDSTVTVSTEAVTETWTANA